MARFQLPASEADKTLKDPAICDLCGTKVARKGDMPRHMRRHLSAEEKASKSYVCPYPNCTYSNLQKGNVDTHIRSTHTKIKNQICPDCDFVTADPGSLTRHRKRRHEYVPKPRKPRTPGNRSSYEAPTNPAGTQIIIETPASFAQKLEPASPSLHELPLTPSGSAFESIATENSACSPKPESVSPSSRGLPLELANSGYESDVTDINQFCPASNQVLNAMPPLVSTAVDPYPLPRRTRRLGLFDILSGDGPVMC